MTTVDDLYRTSTCPELLWFVEIDLAGPGIGPLSFGTAYQSGSGIKRLEASPPVFDFRADFTDAAVSVSAITFAIPPDDFELRRQLREGYWDGHGAAFYVGVKGWSKDDYVQVFAGVVESIQYDLTTATLAVRAQNAGLKKEIRRTAYAGDGTFYEGGPELGGNKKPLGLGVVVNDTPQLLNRGYLAFQYSQGASQQAISVYDNAIGLTKGPDIGPSENIETLPPPADGTFRDQPSESVFVLGAPPTDTSQITCTFEGSTENGGHQETTAGMVLQLLKRAGYDESDIDPVSYAFLQASYAYRCGISIEEGETYLSAITRLMQGAHGGFGVGATGLYEFWLYRSRPTDCDITIPEENIIDMRRGPNLPPVDTLIINGARNNTVQEQIADGADETHAAYVSKQFRPYGPIDEVMDGAFPDAQSVTIDTYQYGIDPYGDDARLFHQQLSPTFIGIRATWLVEVGCHNFKIQRGSRVCINTDELGLNNGPLYAERVREFIDEKVTEITLARTIPLV